MKLEQVRVHALAAGEGVTEAPHHHLTSWRVHGRILATALPDGSELHLFVDEATREQALALHPQCTARLMWGGKAVGLNVQLGTAPPAAVKSLLRAAWQHQAGRPAPRVRTTGRRTPR